MGIRPIEVTAYKTAKVAARVSYRFFAVCMKRHPDEMGRSKLQGFRKEIMLCMSETAPRRRKGFVEVFAVYQTVPR